MDQSLYCPGFFPFSGRHGEGIFPEKEGRLRLAVGYVAAGHGHCRLHESGRSRLVSGEACGTPRSGSRLLQDGFRRTDSHGLRLFQRGGSCQDAQLLYLSLQQMRV